MGLYFILFFYLSLLPYLLTGEVGPDLPILTSPPPSDLTGDTRGNFKSFPLPYLERCVPGENPNSLLYFGLG
jgi:hypothetical protein